MRRRTRQSARGRKAAYREFRDEDDWAAPEPEPLPGTAPAAGAEEDAVLAADLPPEAPEEAAYMPAFSLPPRRKTNFRAALAFSVVLHLSSVTLFSVVAYFPRQDLRYYEFSLVQAAPPAIAAAAAGNGGDRLRLGRVADGFAELEADELALPGIRTPDIELPTLEFAELSRLRIRQESARDLSRYDELVRPAGRDPWRLLEEGVSQVRDTLADWNLPLGLEQTLPAAAPAMIQPAPGFEGRIDWGVNAPARPLLFAPPMTVLAGIEPQRFAEAVEIVFQINAEGRVTNVWSPSLQSADLLDRIQLAVLRYRFEPLDTAQRSEQTGTLYLSPARERP